MTSIFRYNVRWIEHLDPSCVCVCNNRISTVFFDLHC